MWYIYIHISNMEIITLSEVIRERDKYHRVSLICGILKKKNDTSELIYKTEIDSQPQQTMVTKREGSGEE